jgi:hypothetical protein
MALLDINAGSVGVLEFSRGNIGTLVDISSRKAVFEVPAGAGAGAVFPPVGDVDQGVAFGPTGSDYTGTLEQPAEADVMLGVQYGAGGTEFTGEAVGGGEEIFVISD